MACRSTGLKHLRILLFRIRIGPALALIPLALTARIAQAQAQVTVAGGVRDTSGGVVVNAVVEALVGERVIARATTGADGAYSLAVPVRTPIVLRTHRAGFADAVIEPDGTASNLTRDVTLSIGALSDTLVVTASRGPESRTSVTQSLSVVTRADVQALKDEQRTVDAGPVCPLAVCALRSTLVCRRRDAAAVEMDYRTLQPAPKTFPAWPGTGSPILPSPCAL
jgi:hypothetical protein